MGRKGRLVRMCYCWRKLFGLTSNRGFFYISVEKNVPTDKGRPQDSLKVPSAAVVTLRLDEAGDVWHVEFSSNSSVRLLPFVFFFFTSSSILTKISSHLLRKLRY